MKVQEKYIVVNGDQHQRLLLRYKYAPTAVAWEYDQATIIWFHTHYLALAAFNAMKADIIQNHPVNVKTQTYIHSDDGLQLSLQPRVNFRIFNKNEDIIKFSDYAKKFSL